MLKARINNNISVVVAYRAEFNSTMLNSSVTNPKDNEAKVASFLQKNTQLIAFLEVENKIFTVLMTNDKKVSLGAFLACNPMQDYIENFQDFFPELVK